MPDHTRATLRATWLTYLQRVIPPDAPEVQVTESRRAFYAGAQALFGLLLTALDPEQEPTEADLARVTVLHNELSEFARAVARGEA